MLGFRVYRVYRIGVISVYLRGAVCVVGNLPIGSPPDPLIPPMGKTRVI